MATREPVSVTRRLARAYTLTWLFLLTWSDIGTLLPCQFLPQPARRVLSGHGDCQQRRRVAYSRGLSARIPMQQTRNPCTTLATDWFDTVRINRPATERRAATLGTRRSVKGVRQAAWLVNAIRC